LVRTTLHVTNASATVFPLKLAYANERSLPLHLIDLVDNTRRKSPI